jgi:hypothetical protein
MSNKVKQHPSDVSNEEFQSNWETIFNNKIKVDIIDDRKVFSIDTDLTAEQIKKEIDKR